MDLSAVIVNYRRYDLLARCVDALQGSSHPPKEIIVVDNASTPPALADFSAGYPDVRALANTENVGYAAACNQGWHASAQPLVLFINPDVTVAPDCLERCAEAIATDETIGAVTCRLLLPDGRMDHASHRGLPTPSASLAYMLKLHRLFPRSRLLGRYTMSWLDRTTDHDVEACSGAFILVRRALLEQLGGWDEGYWFYGEDLDLCHRIGQGGARIRYLGTVTAMHAKGAHSRLRDRTSGLTAAERVTKRRVQAALIDSHSRFFTKHFAASTAWPLRLLIRSTFAAQRLRLGTAVILDRLTARAS